MSSSTGSVSPARAYACTSAREQLLSLALPTAAGTPSPTNCFFPKDRLVEIYTKDKVLEILLCECSICQVDRDCFEGHHDTYAEKIVEHCVCLFALLIYVKHPVFIVGFVQAAHDDHLESPDNFTDKDLETKYWPRYKKRNAESSQNVAEEFLSYKYQFFVPLLDDTYQVYHEDAILPFCNQSKIGIENEDGEIESEGSFGTVYKLEIPKYYVQNLPEIDHITMFARKELNSKNKASFWLEADNLTHIQDLFDDKHVVRMVKAYKRGHVYNILFPYAGSNLDRFLRDETSSDFRHGPPEHNPLRGQMLGITKALRDMSEGIKKFEVKDQERWIGYHFDLKPANILIFDNETWAISDFGQAAFIPRARRSSQVKNQGGSDAYSAPEIENPDAKAGPRYDVWSLGCILLEVVTFLVVGPTGLTGSDGLDNARRTKPPNSRGEDSRLWQHDGETASVVKPEVRNFMERLPARLPANSKSRQFLEAMLVLIDAMLRPDPELRLDATGVVRQLERIIDEFNEPRSESIESPIPMKGERELGAQFLKDQRRLWHFKSPENSAVIDGPGESGDTVGVMLHLFEQRDGTLRVTLDGPHKERSFEIHKPGNMFVPIYVFQLKLHEYVSHRHFYISPRRELDSAAFADDSSVSSFDNTESLVLRNLAFAVSPDSKGQPSNAMAAQAAFTGQEVVGSLKLSAVRLSANISIPAKITKIFSRGLSFRKVKKPSLKKSYVEFSSIRVQIWHECESLWNRAARAGTLQEAKPRRIAIFTEDRTIMIIRVMKEWMMNDEPNDPDSGRNIVRFVPTKPSAVSSFPVATLKPRHALRENERGIAFAGIPLHPATLRECERETERSHVWVELEFNTPEDAKAFRSLLKEEQWQWRKERKNLEQGNLADT